MWKSLQSSKGKASAETDRPWAAGERKIFTHVPKHIDTHTHMHKNTCVLRSPVIRRVYFAFFFLRYVGLFSLFWIVKSNKKVFFNQFLSVYIFILIAFAYICIRLVYLKCYTIIITEILYLFINKSVLKL